MAVQTGPQIGGYDQESAVLAEAFVPYVTDNVFQSARVPKIAYDSASRVEEGRYLALPLLTAKNQTAQSFGQYDTLASGPQSLLSVAAFPWSWYQAAVTIDYQTLRLVRGPNMRVDNLTLQVQACIASLSDLIANDLTNTTKGASSLTGYPALGVIEASDNGQLFNVYGNIARTGTNSLANWQGNVISLATSGLGSSTNDTSRAQMLREYTACVIGDAAPTHIFCHQQAVSSYIFTLDSQIRVSPGDSANPYTGNPHLLGAEVVGDNHFTVTTNVSGGSTYLGYTYYFLNMNHTRMQYFGFKGFDYVPWIDTPNVLSKTSRYVIAFQFASDEPRLNGWYGPINDLSNL
jgi:hypothetical protein